MIRHCALASSKFATSADEFPRILQGAVTVVHFRSKRLLQLVLTSAIALTAYPRRAKADTTCRRPLFSHAQSSMYAGGRGNAAEILVVSILEKCEAITFPASSAEQALSMIVSERPDVLVSDIGMPGMDGYDLLRAVRALPDERAQRVPALSVTAYARSEDQRRALAEGFQLHLAKPIEPAAFANAVARLSRNAEVTAIS